MPSLTAHLAGYIRVNADDLDHAKSLLAGNPHFEAGGTVEIRSCHGRINFTGRERFCYWPIADIRGFTAHVCC